MKEEEDNKKAKKDELEVIKSQFDQAKVDEANSKEQRRQYNIKYKEITAKVHEIELNIEKEKKLLKRLEKEEAVEQKKFDEIKEINKSLVAIKEIKEK